MDSEDEAVAAIAKHNWADLRAESLEDRGSAAYRKAVFTLAEEIAKRTRAVRELVDDVPLDESVRDTEAEKDEDDAPGVIDLLAAAEEAFPHLNEVMEVIGNDIQLIGSITEETGKLIDAAAERGAGLKPALTLTEQLARKLAEPAGRIERNGREYAVTLAALDPGVQTNLDLIEEREQAEDEVTFLRSVQEMAEAADQALDQLQGMVDEARAAAKLSRSLRGPLGRMQRGIQECSTDARSSRTGSPSEGAAGVWRRCAACVGVGVATVRLGSTRGLQSATCRWDPGPGFRGTGGP